LVHASVIMASIANERLAGCRMPASALRQGAVALGRCA
jgi:hypothetical protein